MLNNQSDHLDFIYKKITNTQRRGIGNCTQASNRVRHLLNTGQDLEGSFWQRLPGFSDKEFIVKYEGDGAQFISLLSEYLQEGQHVQVCADMKGYIHEAVSSDHVFNAIKLEGQIKIIDNYQGWSTSPWLNQAWNDPTIFLKYFKNFYTSMPENSYFTWKKSEINIESKASSTLMYDFAEKSISQCDKSLSPELN
ncbi:hypothetical protein [Piscirickettsia salmonis]|uniref:hypothetical protein n=1 Tax=Piscirickettsia salmonis TaxID=1238 RepID=UPI0007C936A2|nr:hypothetical protein A0O36_02683 [Piscirickettsiaceae bacterium NZ-RLO1]